jgi:tRNA nucleotidyltransferase (CCA-adding enzyme)
MNIKQVLSTLDLMPGKEDIAYLKKETEKLTSLLRDALKRDKISAEVFVGGSYTKNTLIKGKSYDIDVFARFDWKYEELSPILEKIVKKVAKKGKFKMDKIHGSRDYFRLWEDKKAIFEIIPVTRIKKPKEARNVTDLSYFHVNYVKRKLKGDIAREVILAKQFCKANDVYGAESYVNGFSGYALECLIIYYKSFEKMLRELGKMKENERLIIDPGKKFKKKSDVLFELNESKLGSPIILIDPTWKERNALAALSRETFRKFQESAAKFLKKPSKEFFVIKEFDASEFKKKAKKGEQFVSLAIETDRQEGDIAGTKMRKFSNYISKELAKYFEIIDKKFDYKEGKKSDFYIIAKSKKEIIKIGPPIGFEKHAAAFKKENKKVYEKNGILYARIKINFTAKEFLRKLEKNYNRTIKGMGITGLRFN